MKAIFNTIIFFSIAVLISTGCKKSFSDLYPNDNKPTSVPASLLFNGIVNQLYDAPYSMYERWGQYYLCNYDYYGNNRYDFSSGTNFFSTLKNVGKMVEEAKSGGLPDLNPYSALAKYFRAYFFTQMSLQMGDVPMTEALKGLDNLNPVYDPQKKVFQQAFVWLDSANIDLTSLIAKGDKNLSGDIYYGNNLSKWQKLVNTYRLRLLLELSKKVGDADLNLKQQFTTILSNKSKYPVMESSDDNLQYVYIYPTNNYPNNPGNLGYDALRYNTSATYIGLLTQLKDPRVFVTAEPAAAITMAGTPATSFSAFIGADPGEDLGTMYVKANNFQYSLLNRKRYYSTFTAENSIQVGYPELLFNIAEAINMGWITSGPLGNAEAHYMAGIKESMKFYGIPATGSFTAYFLHFNSVSKTYASIDGPNPFDSYTINFDFPTYYSQALVKYAGDNASGLNQILTQRYLALFRHSGLESYFTYRRTNVPVFTTGPGTGNSARIAMRFKYPSSEQTANTRNYQAALQSQYNGNDDINGMMWIIK